MFTTLKEYFSKYTVPTKTSDIPQYEDNNNIYITNKQ